MPSSPSAPHEGFYAIAHRAGNNLHTLQAALEAGVDAIECDFWHDRGRLSLRHERKLPALPVLYDKWILRWQVGHLNLPDLLREMNFRAQLFLDIKSASSAAADAVLDLYHDNESMMPPAIVSSQQWALLDRIAAAGTRMQTCYSIGARGQIDAIVRRAVQDPRPHGVSVRHALLSADVVARLHGAGLRVYAWTVNTARRAHELRALNVDALISDDLGVLVPSRPDR